MDHQNTGYASLISEQDMRKERLIAVLENGAPNVQAHSTLAAYEEQKIGQENNTYKGYELIKRETGINPHSGKMMYEWAVQFEYMHPNGNTEFHRNNGKKWVS